MPKCTKCGHSTCTCCRKCHHRQSNCTCKTKSSSEKRGSGSGSGSDDSRKSKGSHGSGGSSDSQKTHSSGKSELTELTRVYSEQIRSIIEKCEKEIIAENGKQALPDPKIWTDEMKAEYADYKAKGKAKDNSRKAFQRSYEQSLMKNASAEDFKTLRKDALTWAGDSVSEMKARLEFLIEYEGAYHNTKGHIEAVKNLTKNGRRAVNHAKSAKTRLESIK
ncbi:hypothetical protein BPAE_0935g00010 [Botrytis paeoniae]|uniref:Uncharacterized protein n=1 Tax=Botrytis paeoniae TaxID=278948 RepID=A0A4Z1EQ49_9HELO|nr:hypothetical protein BPAE_0935g00010 [Botrytis paeoniae]